MHFLENQGKIINREMNFETLILYFLYYMKLYDPEQIYNGEKVDQNIASINII